MFLTPTTCLHVRKQGQVLRRVGFIDELGDQAILDFLFAQFEFGALLGRKPRRVKDDGRPVGIVEHLEPDEFSESTQ